MPEGAEEGLLGGEERGVSAGVELGGGPVEFEDLGVGGGETFNFVRIYAVGGCWKGKGLTSRVWVLADVFFNGELVGAGFIFRDDAADDGHAAFFDLGLKGG